MDREAFDLVVRGGTVVTAVDSVRTDIGIRDGRIAALARGISGAREIDAAGRLVLPGGIEAHCHIAQESSSGLMTATDYRTGSIAAAFGGNTCFLPFAAQQRGETLSEALALYDSRSEGNSVIDYGYHLIVSDPRPEILRDELPMAVERGVTSLKVFMTYDLMRVDDEGLIEVLAAARENGALTMVHAENDGMVKWMTGRLLARGFAAPRHHAASRPRAAEVEAIQRVILLARFVEAPLMVVHVSTDGGARAIAAARAEGAEVYGETCPQYLFLEAADLDRDGLQGGKFICAPPVRGPAEQEALWAHLKRGHLQMCNTDHAPYRFDETGKLAGGRDKPFNRIAPGMPGIELRLPLLFSEGVHGGRITVNEFVSMTATNAARIYGLLPAKGTISVGADADLAIWDPDRERTAAAGEQRDGMDYSPFEGRRIRGWPVTVINRGEVIVEDGALRAEPGRGRFVARSRRTVPDRNYGFAPELDPARNFGARLV